MSQLTDGHYTRAAEKLTPKFIRDYIATARYATEGETTQRGESVLEDFSLFELAAKFGGFSPASISETYDGRRSVKNRQKALSGRRAELLRHYRKALKNKDSDERAAVVKAIIHFNQLNPFMAITQQAIVASIQSKARQSQQTTRGINLPRKQEVLRGLADYADN